MYQRCDNLPIRIISQGAVRVSHAYVERDYGDALLIYVDLNSKYAEVAFTGYGEDCGPQLSLIANEHTLHLDESKPLDDPTTIEFCEQKGWRIFSVDGPNRYTMNVTLVSPEDNYLSYCSRFSL